MTDFEIFTLILLAVTSILVALYIFRAEEHCKKMIEWEKIKHKHQMDYAREVVKAFGKKAPPVKKLEVKKPKAKAYNPSQDQDLIMKGNYNEFYD